jgi:hypothetical protein
MRGGPSRISSSPSPFATAACIDCLLSTGHAGHMLTLAATTSSSSSWRRRCTLLLLRPLTLLYDLVSHS